MPYKHGYEDIDLFVEQGTDRVPDDGHFYFVLRGRVIDQEATLKRALGRLQQLRSKPPSDEEIENGSVARAKMMNGEMASRHLQQSTAEKTADYGKK